MYALVNTFERDALYLGRVASRHRTPEMARKAQTSHLKAVKRTNGGTSYVPTVIGAIQRNNLKKGDWVCYEDIRILPNF